MSKEEKLQLENALLLTCSKAQAINKYIDELEESSKLSELWCKSQEEKRELQHENQKYKEVIDKAMALVNNELYRNRCDCKFCNDYYLKNMRNILKEVE